jgi:hypothetical protein
MERRTIPNKARCVSPISREMTFCFKRKSRTAGQAMPCHDNFSDHRSLEHHAIKGLPWPFRCGSSERAQNSDLSRHFAEENFKAFDQKSAAALKKPEHHG